MKRILSRTFPPRHREVVEVKLWRFSILPSHRFATYTVLSEFLSRNASESVVSVLEFGLPIKMNFLGALDGQVFEDAVAARGRRVLG